MISFILPAYNEAGVIQAVYQAVRCVVLKMGYDYEFVFVNDGSMDGTADEIKTLHQSDLRVKLINLSRNFGQQVAVTAGLEHASGDAVIIMDCDMQDDPSVIPEFVDKWQEGYDVVYALRAGRKENVFKRVAFKIFHKVNHLLSEIHVPADTGLFCLISRRALRELNRFKERNRYLPGLRFWVGFKQVGISVPRLKRYDDIPRVSLRRLIFLSIDSMVSSSKIPLRLATFLGFFMFCFAMLVSGYVIYSKYITLKAIPGWASETGLILFFGGTQFIILGILGEYIARIYDEVKGRPLYIVESRVGEFNRTSGVEVSC